MDILMLVDRLEAVINGGWRPPMTDKVMIDEQEALEVIDLMRTAIPEEIKQSRRVNQDRERLIAEAQEDANRLMNQAEDKLRHLTNDKAVVQVAQRRATEIEQDAYAKADEIRTGADQYAYDVLNALLGRLDGVSGEIKNGLEALGPIYEGAADSDEESFSASMIEVAVEER